MRTLNKMMFAGLALSFSMLGHANTVTFDDLAPQTVGNFQSGGFNFAMSGSASVVYNGQWCGPSCPVNGTNIALMPYGPASLVMSQANGAAFSLSHFDGAGSFNFNEWGSSGAQYFSQTIDVTGVLASGGTVSQSFQIDHSAQSGPLAFTTYSFNSGFNNLSSVTFSASGSSSATYNGFSVDNIAAVPEPETYAMLLGGLGLLGFMARRRKQVVA